MKSSNILSVALLLTISFSVAAQKKKSTPVYYPESSQWTTKSAADVGMNADKIQAAIKFVKEKESKIPRNLEQAHYQSFGREPFGEAVGPFAERGEATGMIIRNGYIIAEWGDPQRVDMTFSVTKSFLSTVVGLAYDKGLIPSINDTMYRGIAPIEI